MNYLHNICRLVRSVQFICSKTSRNVKRDLIRLLSLFESTLICDPITHVVVTNQLDILFELKSLVKNLLDKSVEFTRSPPGRLIDIWSF